MTQQSWLSLGTACLCSGGFHTGDKCQGTSLLVPKMYSKPVVLSEAPREGARESKDPEDVSTTNVASGSSLDTLSPEPHFASPVFGQVLPARVGFFDQCNLFVAPPAFELFLAANRPLDVIVGFVINQPMDFVFFW